MTHTTDDYDYSSPSDDGGLCSCGSGEFAEWEFDAQGIELCKACPSCRAEKLARYRPCILSGYTQEDVDEPIEPEL